MATYPFNFGFWHDDVAASRLGIFDGAITSSQNSTLEDVLGDGLAVVSGEAHVAKDLGVLGW